MWKHARRHAILIEGDRQQAAHIAHNRLSIVGVFFVLFYFLALVRLMDLSIVQGEFLRDHIYDAGQAETAVKTIAPRRGDIFDAHGFLVATSLKTPSLFVDPSLVLDGDELLRDLAVIFPDLDIEKAQKAITAKNRFGWLKHSITPEQQQAVLEIGTPALGFQSEYKRIYPQGELFAHMVGYTDRDGLGLSGIERSYDDVLSAGDDVHLTLDLRLQHLVKREVTMAMNSFNAKAATGLVMDAKTGEMLAAVSLPDFDLNSANTATDFEKFNRLSLGVYELGSMFKIFSTAALLETHDMGMDYTFDARKPIKVGWHTINDYHAQKRILTIPEVFMHSSNIGSAMMGEMVGAKGLQAFYADLGLMDKAQFDIREVGAPIVPDPWRESTTMTVAYGHGLATSVLQMSSAVATIVNGGLSVRPSLVKDRGSRKSEVRVVSEETSDTMRKLLRLVVTKGTGKNAEVHGYDIGGKTGTAEKSIAGKYHRDKLISSFVGAFPMTDPKYVVMVMVDEPKGNEKSYGYATAGWVAAPAARHIVSSMASVLGIQAQRDASEPDISDELSPFIHEKKKGAKHLVSY